MAAKAPIRISLLGGFELYSSSGETINIPTKKAKCLLAYLAMHKGQRQAREKLYGLLWGDLDEKRAAHNLRQAFTDLRKSFNGFTPPPLMIDRTWAQVADDRITVDALDLLRHDEAQSAEDLEETLDLYKGELLEGFGVSEPGFEDWLEEQRRHLNSAFRQGVERLLDMKHAAGRTTEALKQAQRLLALDPLQERVHRTVMSLYAELGEREAALKQFELCRDLLSSELNIEPEAETLTLYEELRSTGNPTMKKGLSAILAETPLVEITPRSWGQVLFGSAILSLALLIGVYFGLRSWPAQEEPASMARMAHPLPDMASVAVLPFANYGDDPAQGYFADGITDDLITNLSKLPSLFVIARNSTFSYKGNDVPIRQVAEELGVRYVIEGSVRRNGDQIRINVQLIDATTGGHIWAELYERPIDQLFTLQDHVIRNVASSLRLELTDEDFARLSAPGTDKLEAYDALLHSMEYLRSFTKDDLAIAISYLEKALNVDPNYTRAHTRLGAIYWDIANDEWARSFGLTHEEALEKARHHLELGMAVPSYVGHIYFSKMHSNEGRYEEAVAEAKIGVSINPNGGGGYEALGRALNKAGRAPEAIRPLQMAIRLDPRGDEGGWLHYRLGESLYLSDRYPEAAEIFTVSASRNQNEWTFLFQAAALAQAGEQAAAAAALATFERIRADAGEDPYTVAQVEEWAFKNNADRKRVQDGLRLAGMPEGAATEMELNYAQDLTPSRVEGATTIDTQMAADLLGMGTTFVDVRDQATWTEGHIPGTEHMYLFKEFTEEGLSKLASKKEAVVLFGYGMGSSKFAAIAATRAVSWGFEQVYYFPDGYLGWKAAGHPVKLAPDD